MNPYGNTPKGQIDRWFWLIILGSWTMEKVAELAEYAAETERSVQW